MIAIPTAAAHFKVFGALRNLPCAAELSVREVWGCGISSRLSNNFGARRAAAHMVLAPEKTSEMRGGAARSNLQTPAPILWIEFLFVVIPEARSAIRNPRGKPTIGRTREKRCSATHARRSRALQPARAASFALDSGFIATRCPGMTNQRFLLLALSGR